ncbi:calcium uptake protein 3, mitochondrial-like isoform X3 [Clavelina lepadiformis]|uniref:calcium uptake protein 3, mitochondrial-like isoform X3 n=1 Tax=Clavelina lepadiformis TaxID=159417 RepID=UPI0040411CAA
MSGFRSWKRLFPNLQNAVTKRNVLVGICTVCGSSVALYSMRNVTGYQDSASSMLQKSLFKSMVVYAAKPVEPTTSIASQKQAGETTLLTREKRFYDFASVEYEGELFMTPQDFLESVTDDDPRPRIGHLKLTEAEVEKMLKRTPDRKKNSSRFFRDLHNLGLISYTEYLFFLCILTKPNAGFNIAFNMFDADGNQRVDKKEFMVLGEIFRKSTENISSVDQESVFQPKDFVSVEQSSEPSVGHFLWQRTTKYEKKGQTMGELRRAIKEGEVKHKDTSLLIHLFGKNGQNDLRYEDFCRFMENLQTEVLEIEFLAYSRGMVTISEVDFARMVLKYTDVVNTEEYIENVTKRIPEEKGITFEDFRSFFLFLNNLEDFAIAMQMYTLTGRSIGQAEFKRAVKVSTGHELSEHLVDTLFQLFDKDGDNRLSQTEFIGVMKDRIHRGFRANNSAYNGWPGFQKCIRATLRQSKA